MYYFYFQWKMFLFAIFFIIVFCSLGTWQFHRYQEKKQWLTNYHAAFVNLHTAKKELSRLRSFQPILVYGQYQNHLTFFIEKGFTKKGKIVSVLTPLKVKGINKLLLINRGDIIESKVIDHQYLLAQKGMQKITGYIKAFNEYHFILGPNVISSTPLILQKIDMKTITAKTKVKYLPFLVLLHPNAANGFLRHIIITNVSPKRHLAYAIQWYLMAFTLTIAFFCFSYKKRGLL